MGPSNRAVAMPGAAGKRPRLAPPPKLAKRPKSAPQNLPLPPAQSSILRFLVPKSSLSPCDKPGQIAAAPEVEVIDLDDAGVTGVSPADVQANQISQPESLPPPPPQPPPPPLPRPPAPPPQRPLSTTSALSVKQVSLLRFFSVGSGDSATTSAAASTLTATTLATGSPPRRSSASASGTWPAASGRSACPPVKWVDGTSLTVDAFNYGAQARCQGYFLSHFHSDHYCGLGRRFDGQLLASRQTAELARLRLGVRPVCLRPLDLQKWYDVPGAQVLLLDANHCPGSVMLLFRLPSGRRILHTGDFRASPDLLASVLGWLGEAPEIDSVYLDTTYCSPEYDFPPQAEAIQAVLRLVAEFVREYPRYLIVCGSYALGKERVFVSIARHLGCRAGVDPAKFRLLNALGDPEISEWIVRTAPGASCPRLQVLPLRSVSHAGLRKFLAADWRGPPVDGVLGVSPTGWSLGAKGVQIGPGLTRLYGGGGGGGGPTIAVYAVAYSEHSSYGELRDFVRGLRPRCILPTVNWQRRDTCRLMRAHFDRWLAAPR